MKKYSEADIRRVIRQCGNNKREMARRIIDLSGGKKKEYRIPCDGCSGTGWIGSWWSGTCCRKCEGSGRIEV